MSKETARDLIGLFLVLGMIIAGMLAFNKKFRDPQGDAQKEWYYKRIAPPGASQQQSR